MFKSKKNYCRPFAIALRRDNDKVVQNGLAITPSEMEDMVKRGIPVSAQSSNLLKVQDTGDADWNVPLGFRRGVDPLADGYQNACDVQSRFRDALSKHHDSDTSDGSEGSEGTFNDSED